jgi:RNA polymerase sigma-70 factor (ECF subfamily)
MIGKNKMLNSKLNKGEKLPNISLFEKLTPDIKKYFLSLGLNNETSEDLSQDVFIKMTESYADKKESKKNLRSLMYEVARNVRNDHFRKAYRIPKLQSLEEVEYYLADNVEVESTVVKNLESNELKDKIDLLPPLKQKILELKYNFNFSYQEIAEIMNLELGTVKSQLFRAKEELKTLISKDFT